MTAAPNEFIADCMTIVESEKTEPCIPDGSPMRVISATLSRRRQISRSSSRQSSVLLTMQIIIRTAERYCETTVAIATPSASIPIRATQITFRMTFTSPAVLSIRKGLVVSPFARSTAARKLYARFAGEPRRYIRRYTSANGRTSSGVFMSTSIGLDSSIPTAIARNPHTSERPAVV